MSNSQAQDAIEPGEMPVRDIFQRLKSLENLAHDVDVPKLFGATNPTRTAANWKTRGTIPFVLLIGYALEKNISLDWLILGRGVPSFAGVNESPATYGQQPDEDQLLRAVVRVTEEALEEKGVRLGVEKKTELVALLYEDAKRHRHAPMQERVERLLKLVE